MEDIFGQALYDHYQGAGHHKLWINNQYGPREEMPVAVYFRPEDEISDMERLALNQCRGKVLDIGAGAGSHALVLQKKDYEVTALDISGLAVRIMLDRGVKQAVEADIFTYADTTYDTLLLQMNGIGLTGNIAQLRTFLAHAKTLLNKGGQLLFDSSDIAYLYGHDIPAGEKYYGELSYQYVYKGKKTAWFQWLYIHQKMLVEIAWAEGWKAELLAEDDQDQYLARLTPLK